MAGQIDQLLTQRYCSCTCWQQTYVDSGLRPKRVSPIREYQDQTLRLSILYIIYPEQSVPRYISLLTSTRVAGPGP